jgi:hypothetical protein
MGASFISGTFYVPHVTLSAATQTAEAAILKQAKEPMTTLAANNGFGTGPLGEKISGIPSTPPLMASSPVAVTTVAEFINAILGYRTPDYLKVIANWPDFPVKTISPNPALREVSSVTIGTPTAAQFQALLGAGQSVRYIPSLATSPALSNFGLDATGSYYTNTVGQWMECDGDLVVDGTVFLQDLQLSTMNGCRIYATGTIVVQAAQGSGLRDGITYQGGANANLQLSSAREITLGIGNSHCTASPNTIASRVAHEVAAPYFYVSTPKLSGAQPDLNKIRDASGISLLIDASGTALPADATATCGNFEDPSRRVSLSHMLLNAPRIDSRYTGGLNGVVIANFLLWSRGEFHYTYDSVFDSVPILPLIPAGSLFEIGDCQSADGTDNSHVVDTTTGSRSCN